METIKMILFVPLMLANAAVLTSNIDDKVAFAWIVGWSALIDFIYI